MKVCRSEAFIDYKDGSWVYHSEAFTALKKGLKREPVEDWQFVFLPQATNRQILNEFSRFLKAIRSKEAL